MLLSFLRQKGDFKVPFSEHHLNKLLVKVMQEARARGDKTRLEKYTSIQQELNYSRAQKLNQGLLFVLKDNGCQNITIRK